MKILFVNYEYPPLGGGGGIVNAWLAEALAKRHDVSVLTSRAFDLSDFGKYNGVKVYRCPTNLRRSRANASLVSMASFVARANRFASKRLPMSSYDILNTHFALPTGPVGAQLAKRFGKPNVLSVHGGDLYDPSKWMSPHRHGVLRRTITQLAMRADAVVGQSQNTIDNLHNFYAPDCHAELIPLGIPRPPDPTKDRSALGIAPDDIILITVGRLVARKAIHQLIAMMGELANPRVRLLILGDGPQRDELETLSREKSVAANVTFCGFVDDQEKVDLLTAADIYVSTSQHEGFGLVFLEAMAAGLPVVCYDHGGQTDFLNDDTGGTVELNDKEQFIRQLKSLISNDDDRISIGAHNRAAAEKLFIDACAEQYEELFESVILGVNRDRKSHGGV